jgi:hypothetical protein
MLFPSLNQTYDETGASLCTLCPLGTYQDTAGVDFDAFFKSFKWSMTYECGLRQDMFLRIFNILILCRKELLFVLPAG